jgi:succinate dehydrogenase assembly factor 2
MSLRQIVPRIARSAYMRPARTYTTTSSLLNRLQDPYPLPLSNPDLAAAASRTPQNANQLSENDEDWPIPQPLDRTGEDLSTLRARLVYQTRKRGTLETDLILSTFARDALGDMGLEELQQFDKVSHRDTPRTGTNLAM